MLSIWVLCYFSIIISKKTELNKIFIDINYHEY